MSKISMAITTYNRPELTVECFQEIIDHPRVHEICIVDDHSDIENIEKLFDLTQGIGKLWLKTNESNFGMLNNKRSAIRFCDADFVLLADSDNRFNESYLKALPKKLDKNTVYMPEFAEPQFDFTEFSGMTFDKNSIKAYLDDPIFQVMLNACNYVVPRENFLLNTKGNPEIKESDTIWLNYCWLKNGGKFFVVPGMRYFHRIHDDSGWLKNAEYNLKKGDEIIELIRGL